LNHLTAICGILRFRAGQPGGVEVLRTECRMEPFERSAFPHAPSARPVRMTLAGCNPVWLRRARLAPQPRPICGRDPFRNERQIAREFQRPFSKSTFLISNPLCPANKSGLHAVVSSCMGNPDISVVWAEVIRSVGARHTKLAAGPGLLGGRVSAGDFPISVFISADRLDSRRDWFDNSAAATACRAPVAIGGRVHGVHDDRSALGRDHHSQRATRVIVSTGVPGAAGEPRLCALNRNGGLSQAKGHE
jgi:hypothetical protein